MLAIDSAWRRGCRIYLGLTLLVIPTVLGAQEFPDFDLRADCPQALVGTPGEAASFAATVILRTQDNPAPDEGAQAWSLSVQGTGGAAITAATTAGTAAAPAPEGLFDSGFEHTELTSGEGNEGAVSAVVLSFTLPIELPATGDSSLLALTLEAEVPQADCLEVGVAFVDGLRGSGQPVDNRITFRAETRADDGSVGDGPDDRDNDDDVTEPCVLSLCAGGGEGDFRRGNCDGDDQIGLTDAVYLLLHLFQGGPAPGCAKACDSDDSGDLNLTDGVFLLLHLFQGGPAPNAPYPDCGADLTEDELTCPGQANCAGG